MYSSFSFYASEQGGELPASWFVRALGDLGVEENAVRQTLYRMERSGALDGRREGKAKFYRASATTQTMIGVGTARMLEERDDPKWDRRWTLVRFVLESRERKARDRLRDVLTVDGFANLGTGLYVHPRTRVDHVKEAARALELSDSVHVFRGERIFGPDEGDFVRTLWDLDATARRYQDFVDRFSPLDGRDDCTPRDSFALRFGLVFEFLRITWDDPDLPIELLPDGWPADAARHLTRTLYRRLLPGALEFADQVMDSLGRKQ